MKENQFQKKVTKQLEKQAAFIINLHGHLMQKSGLPDLQILHTRWDGFLELKVGKNKASVLQRVIAAKIELRGTPVYVLRCVEVDAANLGINGAYGIYYDYTIENFEGKIIETFDDLNSLLDILVELKTPKLTPLIEKLELLTAKNDEEAMVLFNKGYEPLCPECKQRAIITNFEPKHLGGKTSDKKIVWFCSDMGHRTFCIDENIKWQLKKDKNNVV